VLTKVLASKECTIPVIVNGDASTKGSVQVNNRNKSHKEANGKCKNKPKKNKS
jgi:hypothetical protein